MKKKSFFKVRSLVISILVIIVVIWILAPFTWMVISSLSTRIEITAVPPVWFPSNPSIKTYLHLLYGTDEAVKLYLIGMRNTIIIAGAATFLSGFIGILAAYAIQRMYFRGRTLTLWGTILTQMLPPISVALPLYIILVRTNLIDTHPGLTLVYCTYTLPFTVWIMHAYFKTIPQDLDEAAMVDGCTRLQALFRVILPVCAPGIAASLLFCFIIVWNEFFYALIFTGSTAKMLSVAVVEFTGKVFNDFEQMAAGAVVAVIPPVILALIFQKYLIRGLTLGSVKR